MRTTARGACVILALASPAHAKPPVRIAPHTPNLLPRAEAHPAPPLPMLPSVARVEVQVARDRVVVVQEVRLPRGDWRSGGLDLYVAFGAPSVPLAVDARVAAVRPESLDSRPDDEGDAAVVESAVRRPPSAQLLLGRPQMAGVVIRIKEADLRRAYAASDLAALRIRSLLAPPAADPYGARDVVVRLGISGDLPLTLYRIQVVSLEPQPWLERAEATLCGPEAEGRSLSVALVPRVAEPSEARAAGESGAGRIAPSLAVRHASDDLCIRWWAGD